MSATTHFIKQDMTMLPWRQKLRRLQQVKRINAHRFVGRRHQGLDNEAPDEVYWTTLSRMRAAA
jgi:hypothetical protein